jgi:hypothetical protein
MDKVTEIRLNRLDENQRATTIWLEGLDNRIAEIGQNIVQIQTAIQPRELPWAVRSILLPLAVAAAVATTGGVIHLEIALAAVRGEFVRQTRTTEEALLALQTSQAASNPTDKNSQTEAKNYLLAAKQKSLRIPTTVVAQAGGSFVKASTNESSPWDVALQFLNYRSVLNAASLPTLPALRPYQSSDGKYKIESVIWATHPLPSNKSLSPPAADIWLAGEAPPEASARVEFLDKPLTTSSGAKFIIFDWHRSDIALGLDDVYMKNVIVRNAVIHYAGGPVRLDHVYFVNCTFDIVRQPLGQNLALAILGSPDTTFSVATPQKPSTPS